MVKKQLRKIKFLILKLLRINGNAHSVALGFTIGALVNFVPSFGAGLFLSTFFARLLRGNAVAGFIGGASLIGLFPLLFYLNIVIGEALLFPIQLDVIQDGLDDTDEAAEVGLQIGKAFFVGMTINILSFGALFYSLVYIIIKKYRLDALMFVKNKWNIKKK